ncbi:MAG: 2-oxo acid dehydrogenase subunit E2 [Candidatus Heimdallarchaeota archaeon]|nr:MAG: hypothetical protein DRO63_03395 [Candidatus Gerdarchaeota archaeon]RLI69710.1 MAG: hypothetical protein DRP02_09940 [Candidatus Gerdarchaeota archaeon]RLI70400.1 MAG: hypothetical protein DRO91_06775 [Candidatus Heimdallarchaeota archaeon]
MKDVKSYKVKSYPVSRRITSELFHQALKHHVVHGLLEIDVTTIRKIIRQRRLQGEEISFTGYIVFCLAKALKENEVFNAMRKGNRKVIIFEDVDVALLIEVEQNWKKVPLLFIIRAADKKSFQEINEEIQRAKEAKRNAATKQDKLLAFYFLLPKCIRKWLINFQYKHNPFFRKKMGGTAAVSSVGMFAAGGGWGIPISLQTTFLLVGGVESKPVVRENKIVIREMVNVTFSFDHDLIDGAIASRLTARVKTLIESAFGLEKYLE